MPPFTNPEPLTDSEFAPRSLPQNLQGLGAMNVEELNGFFAALIAGPETVMPYPCGSGKKCKAVLRRGCGD
jgi:hypothetical protein